MNTETTKQEGFIRRKLISPLYNFIKQGTSPQKLAWAVAVGVSFGVFPMLGVTTALCALIALVFRLNMAAIQIINYFMYPLQLILYIPYFAIGSKIFGEENLVKSLPQIFNLLKTDTWGTIQLLWWANVHAVVAWLFTAPFMALAAYLICNTIFTNVAKRIKRRQQNKINNTSASL